VHYEPINTAVAVGLGEGLMCSWLVPAGALKSELRTL